MKYGLLCEYFILHNSYFILISRVSFGVDFFDATDVSASFEFGGEPGVDDVEGVLLGDCAFAEGEYVAVIVGAIPDGELLVPADAATYAGDAVGGDCFAIARAS